VPAFVEVWRSVPAGATSRELRHSFVPLLSDLGAPIDEISRLVKRSGTRFTELVYRHQIQPVIRTGATVKDSPSRAS
jgi:hypothetical protein